MRSGVSYENLWGYFEDKQDGVVTELVFASDGKTVYWKNPLSKYNKSSWIKGEYNEAGTQIVFPAGQYLTYDEKQQYGYQLIHINNIVLNGYEVGSFDVDNTSPIVLAVDGNTLRLEGTDENTIIASVSDDDEPYWNYYGDSQTVLTPFENVPVTAPEGVITKAYTFRYGDGNKRTVNIGTSGTDFYVQGIYSYLPEAWMKGSIEGNTVTLNSGQYFGNEEGAALYWVAATVEEVYNPTWDMYDKKYTYADKITFQYDPETGAYTSEANAVLIANKGETTLYRYGTYISPQFAPSFEGAATPADPEIYRFSVGDEEDEDEEAYIDFYIYTEDVNGNEINANDIYYRIYIDDDQLMTFTPDDYEELQEDMSEFRYDFTDDWDFYVKPTTGFHSIYLYTTFKRIGVQVIYRGGGEERCSNIVYSDGTKTPMSIRTITNQSDAVRTEYFDLSGRRIAKDAPRQVVIKRSIDANGGVSTSKIVNK